MIQQKCTKLVVSNSLHMQHGWIQRGGGGGRGSGPHPLLKNHKATKPAFNVGPSPTHHREAISMVFCWQANDGPFIAVFGSSIPPSTENFFFIKFGPPSDKTFWIRPCATSLHICDVKSADYCCLSFEHVICNNNS